MTRFSEEKSHALTVALRFVERINARDVEGLAALMTPEHVFTDSVGAEVVGAEAVAQAWRGYFHIMSSYAVRIEKSLAQCDAAALFGTAQGVYAPAERAGADGRWSTPAAWLAIVLDERVAGWRVFADNKPVYDLLARFPPA